MMEAAAAGGRGQILRGIGHETIRTLPEKLVNDLFSVAPTSCRARQRHLATCRGGSRPLRGERGDPVCVVRWKGMSLQVMTPEPQVVNRDCAGPGVAERSGHWVPSDPKRLRFRPRMARPVFVEGRLRCLIF